MYIIYLYILYVYITQGEASLELLSQGKYLQTWHSKRNEQSYKEIH